jgi:3-phosphoshikimate 1-carboxyvinyltransferase
MRVLVQPSSLKGKIHAPASKSSMQRACAAALLKKGESNLYNCGKSNDDYAAINVIKNLGAKVSAHKDGCITITSKGVQPESDEINCGESGLGIRMFTPIAALSNKKITINGTGSLVTRPMNFFDEIFPKLSISIKSDDGKVPLTIEGPLQPANIEVDGSLSSQFLTGLLMAYSSSHIDKEVTITVNDLKSHPYIDLTLNVMKEFGLNVPKNNNYKSFTFSPATENPSTIDYTIEGDWSGGAFLLVAGAIAGPITVVGLDVQSTQADKAILEALSSCGCSLSITDREITVGPATLKSFVFDATNCPDLFPPLVALAAYCKGTTTIKGAKRLAHKESDRAITLQEEFGKLGIKVRLEDDTMFVEGGTSVRGASVRSHHDHRIAMACAVAALKARGEVTISQANAINKSYPDFFDHLEQLGASLEESE